MNWDNYNEQKRVRTSHRKPKAVALVNHTLQSLYQLLLFSLVVMTIGMVTLLVSGCQPVKNNQPLPIFNSKLARPGAFKTSYLVDQIDQHYRGTNPGPIGVTTFVNVDDLYATSTFGRLYSEQILSELSLRGYDVVELRHADALQFLSSSGEFALSRDINAIRRERELGGVIVGTYVVSPLRVYLNARLIDPNTSLVMAAGTAEMDKTPEIARLLRGGGMPTALERIPVRRLGLSTYPKVQLPNELTYELEEAPLPPARPKIAPEFAPAPPPLVPGKGPKKAKTH